MWLDKYVKRGAQTTVCVTLILHKVFTYDEEKEIRWEGSSTLRFKEKRYTVSIMAVLIYIYSKS